MYVGDSSSGRTPGFGPGSGGSSPSSPAKMVMLKMTRNRHFCFAILKVMKDSRTATVKTYDDSAEVFADYFKGIGTRQIYINLALKLIGNKDNAKIIEIGCGDGRDAAVIIEKTNDYIGFDPSQGLLELAKKRLPEVDFRVDDALSFEYPQNIDTVFAFASLLHVDIQELEIVIKKLSNSIRKGGILYISLKESDHYEKRIKQDRFGERTFYYYNVQDILDISKQYFEPVAEIHETIGGTRWFELALRCT